MLTQVEVAWLRAGSGFTLLFEALVITLCQMPVNTVARPLGVGDDGLRCILHHYVDGRHSRVDFSAVRAVHVIQLANAAVDEVRRAEVREEPILKHSRWTWPKDKHSWSQRQITIFHALSRLRLKTARAWRLKEALRESFSEAISQAEAEERLSPLVHLGRPLPSGGVQAPGAHAQGALACSRRDSKDSLKDSLEEIEELVDREVGLLDDGPQHAALDVACVVRHDDEECRIGGVLEVVMAAPNPVAKKAATFERPGYFTGR